MVLRIKPARFINLYSQLGWGTDVREPIGRLGYHLYLEGGRWKTELHDPVERRADMPSVTSMCPLTGVHLSFRRAGCFIEVKASGYAQRGEDLDQWAKVVGLIKADK